MTQKTAHPLPPPIAKKIFTPIHPVVAEKDKSIHSTHGVIHYPWWFGGLASCVSVLATQPLGVAGLTASLTRTALYSGVRFGMYEHLKELSSTATHSPSVTMLSGYAAASGATGAVLSNFADVVCLRMQRDPGLPIEHRRNYNSILHGLIKMVSTEGWGSIWTGVGVGAGRAAVATATQLAGYDAFKRQLMKRTSMHDDVPTHVTASCLAGFLSTLVCNPLDVVKARVMTRKADIAIPKLLQQTFKQEGPSWMFKGMTPALISRGPSTVITFVTFEQCKAAYRRSKGLDE